MKRVLFAVLLLIASFGFSAVVAEPGVAPSERVKRSVVVRTQPSTDSDPIGKLVPGDRALLDGEVPGWFRIRLQDGRTGFVSKSWTVLVDTAVPPATAGTGPFKVHVIDVGTGLAMFIEGPGFAMVYDGGSQDDLADGADNRILAYIKAVRPSLQTIDHLVLSHPHKDHLELLPDVFDKFAIRNVWDSGRVNKTAGYCRFLKKVEAEPGVKYHDAIASGGVHEVSFSGTNCSGPVRINQDTQMTSAPVPLGAGAQMTILYRDAGPHSDPNENTVVVRLDLGGKRILLAGDAEAGGRDAPATAPGTQSIEAKLIACCILDLRADVLVVGHHGSLTSSRRAFLNAISASTYIISSGPHPYSGVVLPDHDVVAELQSRGQVFRTDLNDAQCEANPAKIGPDADESPGGCSNIVVSISPSGTLTTALVGNAD